jgi:hypothetical protein
MWSQCAGICTSAPSSASARSAPREERRLLAGTDLAIGEIARRAGYLDGGYFVPPFHTAHRVTPMEWRMRADSGPKSGGRACFHSVACGPVECRWFEGVSKQNEFRARPRSRCPRRNSTYGTHITQIEIHRQVSGPVNQRSEKAAMRLSPGSPSIQDPEIRRIQQCRKRTRRHEGRGQRRLVSALRAGECASAPDQVPPPSFSSHLG